jgi:hypothetical protein
MTKNDKLVPKDVFEFLTKIVIFEFFSDFFTILGKLHSQKN